MARWPEGRFAAPGESWRWNYELATLLNGIDGVWYATADGQYFRYAKASMDALVEPDGSIPTYEANAATLDNIALGRELLRLYSVTRNVRYAKAAAALHAQLDSQPRTASGGYWHKRIYPDQMWLDGLYMAEPFRAEYATVTHEPEELARKDFADIARQFALIEAHARDPRTGLLYHAWDEAKRQPWANRTTGTSGVFWARAMGWYMMALVDTLEYFPPDNPDRAALLASLNRAAEAVTRVQDPGTGLWYQVLDRAGAKGNYLESSAACMFVYVLEKGVRLGYLPAAYGASAGRGWQGILGRFVSPGADGSLSLAGTVKAVGLGGTPYRDGSYEYYVGAPVIANDPKGVGAFLMAAVEIENAEALQGRFDARGQTVLVDAWFNSQQRKSPGGEPEFFHYKWSDFSNDGYSLLGRIFESHGAALATLYDEPTAAKLRAAQYYVIASPDNPAKNPNPHYATEADGEQIAAWVRDGGTLVMFENDPPNADIEHFNAIADRFGIHYNAVLAHHVADPDFAPGEISVQPDGDLFHSPHTLYMKDTCTITVTGPARALLTDRGTTVIATARYGRGTVLAVVDPWLYNEYTDGRKRPPVHDNFAGGQELVRWLIRQHGAVAGR